MPWALENSIPDEYPTFDYIVYSLGIRSNSLLLYDSEIYRCVGKENILEDGIIQDVFLYFRKYLFKWGRNYIFTDSIGI